MIEGCGEAFNDHITQDLLDLIFQALNHANRFVRETGYHVCASLVRLGRHQGKSNTVPWQNSARCHVQTLSAFSKRFWRVGYLLEGVGWVTPEYRKMLWGPLRGRGRRFQGGSLASLQPPGFEKADYASARDHYMFLCFFRRHIGYKWSQRKGECCP